WRSACSPPARASPWLRGGGGRLLPKQLPEPDRIRRPRAHVLDLAPGADPDRQRNARDLQPVAELPRYAHDGERDRQGDEEARGLAVQHDPEDVDARRPALEGPVPLGNLLVAMRAAAEE